MTGTEPEEPTEPEGPTEPEEPEPEEPEAVTPPLAADPVLEDHIDVPRLGGPVGAAQADAIATAQEKARAADQG
jgi:hypothetical protein